MRVKANKLSFLTLPTPLQYMPVSYTHLYDTPCTIENQLALFQAAGFVRAEQVFRMENTTIVIAYK